MRKSSVKPQVVLIANTSNDESEYLLCTLNEKTIPNVILQHEFDVDDGAVFLKSFGGDIHVTGNWIIDENEDECDDEDCQDDDCVVHNDGGSTVEDENNSSQHHSEEDSKIDASDEPEVVDIAPKKTTRNKRGRNGQKIEEQPASQPAPQIVVARPPEDTSGQRKVWKVKPQNDEGLLVIEPKQLTKTTGIRMTDYVIGKGNEPKLGSEVKITYEGMFPNGKIFDSSLKRTKPFKFRRGIGQVIRGLDLGLEGMRVGGSREIIIPPELG